VHDLCPVVEFFQERVKEPIEYRGQKARNVSSWCWNCLQKIFVVGVVRTNVDCPAGCHQIMTAGMWLRWRMYAYFSIWLSGCIACSIYNYVLSLVGGSSTFTLEGQWRDLRSLKGGQLPEKFCFIYICSFWHKTAYYNH